MTPPLPTSTHSPGPAAAALALPGRLAQAVWRGSDWAHLSAQAEEAVGTGFAALDAELPGGGWPLRGLIEILLPPDVACEWRLLGPALAALAARGDLMLVAPPQPLQAAGLAQLGLPPQRLVRIAAASQAQRLWAAEQLVKSDVRGAVVVWLPQARPEHLRRLQVHAQSGLAPTFVIRPLACRREASPAPLRLAVALDGCWHLSVHILKRRGAGHTQPLRLLAVPPALQAVLPPRLRRGQEETPAHDAIAASVLAEAQSPTQTQVLQGPLAPAPLPQESPHDRALGRVAARH